MQLKIKGLTQTRHPITLYKRHSFGYYHDISTCGVKFCLSKKQIELLYTLQDEYGKNNLIQVEYADINEYRHNYEIHVFDFLVLGLYSNDAEMVHLDFKKYKKVFHSSDVISYDNLMHDHFFNEKYDSNALAYHLDTYRNFKGKYKRMSDVKFLEMVYLKYSLGENHIYQCVTDFEQTVKMKLI